jgi:hypothetical protein
MTRGDAAQPLPIMAPVAALAQKTGGESETDDVRKVMERWRASLPEL